MNTPDQPRWSLLLPALVIPFIGTWVFWHGWLPGLAGLAVYAFTKVWYVGCPGYALLRARKSGMPLPRFDRASILWGNLTGIGLCLLLLFGYLVILKDHPFLEPVPEQVYKKLSSVGVSGPGSFAALGFFVILINSSMEELYWRWFVHGGLRTTMPWPYAVLISGIAFSLHHFICLNSYLGSFPIAVFSTAVIAFVGILFSMLWERTGIILSDWICHAWADVGIILVGYLMLQPRWSSAL